MPQIHKKIRIRLCAKVGPLYSKVPGFGYKKWTLSDFSEKVHW